MKNKNINVKIIYEDNHLLVVEKPVNIPTQGDKSKDLDLLTLLKQDLKQRYNKPRNVFLGMVHRLDRPVGGVMVFAKTSKAASRLSEQIRKREMKKVYLAVIHGIPNNLQGRLKHYLIKDKKTNKVHICLKTTEGAKEAELEYNVLKHTDNFSLVKIKLHTGRPHQIRAQFSYIGHPLFGDHKYGKKLKEEKQIALWSAQIVIRHPINNDEMAFNSFPPNTYPWNLFALSEI